MLLVPQFNVNPILAGLTFNWSMSAWLVVLGCLAAAGLAVYLYQAQQKIASRKAVQWLTGIRFALIVLMFLLLAGASWTRTWSGTSGGTLWLVVDQSGSMNQTDKQATPIEKPRWADALGSLPADARSDKLDRRVAELRSLKADLQFHRTRGELAVESKDVAKAKKDYLATLDDWQKKLSAVTDAVERDASVKSTDGSVVRTLRDAGGTLSAAIEKASDKSRREEIAAVLPLPEVLPKLDNAIETLRQLSDKADE